MLESTEPEDSAWVILSFLSLDPQTQVRLLAHVPLPKSAYYPYRDVERRFINLLDAVSVYVEYLAQEFDISSERVMAAAHAIREPLWNTDAFLSHPAWDALRLEARRFLALTGLSAVPMTETFMVHELIEECWDDT